MRDTPIPILIDIGSIDYQEVFVLTVLIDQKVVDHATGFVGKTSILHLSRKKGSYIIGSYLLQKVHGLQPFYPKFSHVRDIEYSNRMAYSQMFVNNARIFYGHVVSRKFMHFSTQCDVSFSKRSCFHAYFPIATSSIIFTITFIAFSML